MLPSQVSIYHQFGVFLILVMTSSWLFATFFFLPLCATFGDILRKKAEKRRREKKGKEKTATKAHRRRKRAVRGDAENLDNERRSSAGKGVWSSKGVRMNGGRMDGRRMSGGRTMTYDNWMKSLEPDDEE